MDTLIYQKLSQIRFIYNAYVMYFHINSVTILFILKSEAWNSLVKQFALVLSSCIDPVEIVHVSVELSHKYFRAYVHMHDVRSLTIFCFLATSNKHVIITIWPWYNLLLALYIQIKWGLI